MVTTETRNTHAGTESGKSMPRQKSSTVAASVSQFASLTVHETESSSSQYKLESVKTPLEYLQEWVFDAFELVHTQYLRTYALNVRTIYLLVKLELHPIPFRPLEHRLPVLPIIYRNATLISSLTSYAVYMYISCMCDI